jgi:hypothetical protein
MVLDIYNCQIYPEIVVNLSSYTVYMKAEKRNIEKSSIQSGLGIYSDHF